MLHIPNDISARLRPWAFPAVAWLIISVMSLTMFCTTAECTPAVCLTDGVWLLLPWVLMSPRWRSWWLVLPVLYGASLMANACFFRVFGDYIPVNFFFRASSYDVLVLSSGSSVMRAVDVVYPLGCVGIVVLWFVRFRRSTPRYSLRVKIAAVATTLLLAFGAFCFQVYRHVSVSHEPYGQRFLASFERAHVLEQDFVHKGYMVSYAFHAVQCLLPVADLTPQEIAVAKQFRREGELPAQFQQAFAANRHKNLIVVMVESLSSVELNTEVNGVRLTPTLDSLLCDSTVLSFTDIQSRVAIGYSSDGHLMTLCGLAPAPSTALSYSPNYTALPSIVRAIGFTSAHSYSGDSPWIWQAYRYLTAAGIDHITGMLCDNPSQGKDSDIFHAALQDLCTAPQPFFAMVITVTMHPPFLREKSPDTAISDANLDDNLKWFYQATRYTDDCIADFLARLKAADLYRNSVVVIVSDHNSFLLKDSPIPLFILNSGLPHRITADRPLTQLDVYPTLLDVMGLCNTDYWPGMGQSALRPGLNPLTEDEFEQRSILSQRLISNDYFNSNKGADE